MRPVKALRRALLLVLCCCVPTPVWAGGARFITGQNWGVPVGWNVVWRTGDLRYFTDPGPLSPEVTHAQADAMVAAAAGVWNLPTSGIAIRQGGVLAEDVDSGNVYFDGQEMVFPADVAQANEGNVPVALVYDSDGSVVDTLLGQGASDPAICRQNAVVGDVDDIHTNDGGIYHATLILNGRCVGTAPEQLLQMQYMLTRAFGRVLGLSWSQTNDNVFTGAHTITANQMTFWPVMHPMDVICGLYSYQCMTEPSRLRQDDLSTLATVYPVYGGGNGKTDSFQGALLYWGILYFPTGQGMAWVNVVTNRQNSGVTEDWQVSSAMTGQIYEQARGTSVTHQAAVNSGSPTQGLDGYFQIQRTPLDGMSNIFFTAEPINPLYSGDAAIGPYVRPPVTPSGSGAQVVDWSALPNGDTSSYGFMTANEAAASCDPGADGTETAPAIWAGSGWQPGLLCGVGHESWFAAKISAGHTWALEVTATDESGAATTGKAQPVVGVWRSTDAGGTEPTEASQPVPFNSMALGVTQLQMGAPDQDADFRMVVTDQFGAGRPDFTYTARLFYAAAVTPATLGTGGGPLTITGSGFRQGNQVLVNGVPARVLSWSATQIVAFAPPMRVAGAGTGDPAAVTVLDTSTNASTTIPNAITYAALPDVLTLGAAPDRLETGITAATPFSVKVIASDGLSAVANAAITFAVTGGSARLEACGGAASCAVLTDAYGVAQTMVSGAAPGVVTLSATENDNGNTLQVLLTDTDPVRSVRLLRATHFVAAGASAAWQVQLTALQDGAPIALAPVLWSGTEPQSITGAAPQTGPGGDAVATVTLAHLAPGSTSTVQACAWGTVCADWTVTGVAPALWRVNTSSGDGQRTLIGGALQSVHLAVSDVGGHPLEQAPVRVLQRVLAWEGECAASGRCASAPVLATSEAWIRSDGDGEAVITPLTVPGLPQIVEIAVTAGEEGFATATLVQAPQ